MPTFHQSIQDRNTSLKKISQNMSTFFLKKKTKQKKTKDKTVFSDAKKH